MYDHLEGFLLGDANMDLDLECSDVDRCLKLQKIIYPTAADKLNSGVTSRVLSEGLVFLQRYLTLSRTDPDYVSRELRDNPSLRELLIRPLLSQCRVYISSISERLKPLTTGQIPDATWNSGNCDTSLPNVGWQYFHPDVPQKTSVLRSSFRYLRRWGFCIWDEERLESWVSYRGGTPMTTECFSVHPYI